MSKKRAAKESTKEMRREEEKKDLSALSFILMEAVFHENVAADIHMLV